MSKVVIQGHASGTGDFTIAAPNSNTDRTLTLPDAGGTVLTSGSNADFPAGSVLQVVSTTKTDTFSATAELVDITGLSLSITPSSTSSKILIICQIQIQGANAGTGVRLLRDSTPLALGDESGSRSRLTMVGQYGTTSPSQFSIGASHINYLDSPSTTSAITYKLQGTCLSSSAFYVNRTYYDSDNSNASRSSSTITVMEIAG